MNMSVYTHQGFANSNGNQQREVLNNTIFSRHCIVVTKAETSSRTGRDDSSTILLMDLRTRHAPVQFFFFYPNTRNASPLSQIRFKEASKKEKVVLVEDRFLVSAGGKYPKRCKVYDRYDQRSTVLPRSYLTSEAVGVTLVGTATGSIYVIGGERAKVGEQHTTNDRLLDTVESYLIQSPTGGGWEEKPSLRYPRKDAAAIEINGRIYVIGGYFWDREQLRYAECPFTEIFDGTQWTVGPSLNIPRKEHTVVAIGGSIIAVVGGNQGAGNRKTSTLEIEVWDTSSMTSFVVLDASRALSVPRRETCSAAFVDGMDLYVFGGGDSKVERLRLDPSLLTASELEPNMSPIPARIDTIPPPTDPAPSVPTEAEIVVTAAATANERTSGQSQGQKSHVISWSLPQPPPLPTMPTNCPTTQDRCVALHDYVARLETLQERYELTRDESIKQVNEMRDLGIESIQKHTKGWLDDLQQLQEKALEEIKVQIAILEKYNVSTSRAGVDDETGLDSFLTGLQQMSGRTLMDEDDVPSQLRCPISFSLMKDPVVAADGNTYERSALEEWFQKSLEAHNENCGRRGRSVVGTFQPRSPLTGAVLPHQQVTPVHALRSLCEQYSQAMSKVRASTKVI